MLSPTKRFTASLLLAVLVSLSQIAWGEVEIEKNTEATDKPESKNNNADVVYLKDGSGVVINGVLYLAAPNKEASSPRAVKEQAPQSALSAPVEPKVKKEEPADASVTPPARKDGKSLLKSIGGKAYFWRLKFYFIAQSDSDCDVFYGFVQDDPLLGLASVDFNFPNGCKCHGKALVTQYPAYGVAGERGKMNAKCDDGRTIHGEFTTTSLTTGFGSMYDSLGHKYTGTFGHNLEQAIKSVNQTRRARGCTDLDKKEVEMVLKGKILPSSSAH